MRNSPPIIVWLVLLLIAAAILYLLWPYLVAFLALLGGVQLLRVWQRNRLDRWR